MFLQICPVCEHRNPRGSRFCNECGSPLQLRFCPACHAAEDVMSLECRSCGEKLPMVVLTDAAASPADVEPATESIWKTEAPAPLAAFEPSDDTKPVTVHGGGTPAPAYFETQSSPESPQVARAVTSTELPAAVEPKSGAAPEPSSTSITRQPAGARKKKRKPSVIEMLREAPAELELRHTAAPPFVASPDSADTEDAEPNNVADVELARQTSAAPITVAPFIAEPPIAEALSAEPVKPVFPEGEAPFPTLTERVAGEGVPLNTESESEIEVSAEAETLVEASMAPVTYRVPEEIAVTDNAQTDQITTQLREGAWRRAMSADSSYALTATPMRNWPPRKRRLSVHGAALVVAALSAVGALVYSVRTGPDTASIAPQASVSRMEPASLPPQRAAEAPPPSPPPQRAVEAAPAAAVATTVPADSSAHDAAPTPAIATTPPAPAPVPASTQLPAEKPADSARPAAVVTEPTATISPAKAPASAPARRPAPAPVVETFTPPAQARRLPVEAPRPCTPAIAALNLCTPETRTE
jgi:hypothetical protein